MRYLPFVKVKTLGNDLDVRRIIVTPSHGRQVLPSPLEIAEGQGTLSLRALASTGVREPSNNFDNLQLLIK